MADPGRYKLMLSHVLEEEFYYPEFIEAWRININLLEELVHFCQVKGLLPQGDVEKIVLQVWSSVHGFISLALERQFPPEYLQKMSLRELLGAAIS